MIRLVRIALFAILAAATGAPAHATDGLISGMADFDVFGLKLGMEMNEAKGILEAKGWKLLPLKCQGSFCPHSFNESFQNPVTRETQSYAYYLNFASDRESGLVGFQLTPPIAPTMEQRITVIEYQNVENVELNTTAPMATREWKQTVVEKALAKYGKPNNPYTGEDLTGQDGCNTGYPDYDVLQYFSVEQLEYNGGDRYVLEIHPLQQCRQIMTIKFIDQANANSPSDILDALKSYLIQQGGAAAGTGSVSDF